MKRIKTILTIAALAIMPLLAVISVPIASASQEVRQGVQATGAGNGTSLRENIEIVTNILLFVVGAVAVIMIIIGGLRYVVSNGDSGQITSAKNTILYAVIGLIIAILAYALVNFVLNQFL